jgi:hypothetical protein
VYLYVHLLTVVFPKGRETDSDITIPPADGILYGQGRTALSASLNVSHHEAERLMDNFLKHFPTMRAFINQVKAKVRLNGFVTMLSGRTRMLPGKHVPTLRTSSRFHLLVS